MKSIVVDEKLSWNICFDNIRVKKLNGICAPSNVNNCKEISKPIENLGRNSNDGDRLSSKLEILSTHFDELLSNCPEDNLKFLKLDTAFINS